MLDENRYNQLRAEMTQRSLNDDEVAFILNYAFESALRKFATPEFVADFYSTRCTDSIS